MDDLLIALFIESYERPPEEIILDLDATDDPIHGSQEGRFFHGYYKCYCYLPLYIFCGEQLLCARLRTADRDASDGSIEELERIVKRLKKAWPHIHIIIRGDSGLVEGVCFQILTLRGNKCKETGIKSIWGVLNPSLLLFLRRSEW